MNQAGAAPLVDTIRRWDVIASFMLEQQYRTLVEVGCKEGRTTGHILKTVPDSHVIAVDPWCAMPDQKGVTGGETYEEWDFEKIEEEFRQNVAGAEDRVRMIRVASARAADETPNEMMDAIFIDAAHDYASVKADIRLWWPKVRPGGMLIGHDFNHKWPGVERAVADSFDLMRVGCAPDSIWFVLKTGDTDVRS